MITCPLCHQLVHLPIADAVGLKHHLQDDETDDFDCPTMIDIAEGRRWSHYSRHTAKGSNTKYSIIHPPFDIIWYSFGQVVVEQFKVVDELSVTTTTRQIIMTDTGKSFEDFLKIAQRFKLLVPFS